MTKVDIYKVAHKIIHEMGPFTCSSSEEAWRLSSYGEGVLEMCDKIIEMIEEEENRAVMSAQAMN